MTIYKASNLLGGTQQNLSSAFKTLASLTAESGNGLVRGKLMDLLLGIDTAPNDNTINFDVSRQTAAGTATGVTPLPDDPADAASRTAAEVNYTAEPTITAASNLLSLPLNQRASQRWTARDKGIIWPATDENGLAVRAKSPAYVSTAVALAEWDE